MLGGGGRGRYAARLFFFFLFSFPCSADHERDWPPCKVIFGFATNTLSLRNNETTTTHTCVHIDIVFVRSIIDQCEWHRMTRRMTGGPDCAVIYVQFYEYTYLRAYIHTYIHTISGCGKERRILIGPW